MGDAGRADLLLASPAKPCARAAKAWPSVRPTAVHVDVTREPVGVVGLIAPWNFPLAIPAWKIAPALAHGNTVVFKPAELVPACGWALADIISRAALPAGAFNLVMGSGREVGQALVDSPGVDALSFTGSVETGERILQAATARHAKVQLEMGGKNPLVVLDDADLDKAVDCAVQERLLLDRPALHGIEPAGGRGQGLRCLRDAPPAAHGEPARRPRAGAGCPHRPGGRPCTAGTEPCMDGHCTGRGRGAPVRRRAAAARHGGPLHEPGAVPRAARAPRGARGNLRADRLRAARRRLRARPGHRQRHAVRAVRGHLHHPRSSTRCISGAMPRSA